VNYREIAKQADWDKAGWDVTAEAAAETDSIEDLRAYWRSQHAIFTDAVARHREETAERAAVRLCVIEQEAARRGWIK
jgi:hypothetical protein